MDKKCDCSMPGAPSGAFYTCAHGNVIYADGEPYTRENGLVGIVEFPEGIPVYSDPAPTEPKEGG